MKDVPRVIFYREGKISIYAKGELVKSIAIEVTYLYKSYFTDQNKVLYKIINDEPVEILHLKKRVSSIFESNGILFIVDVYGDIFKLLNDELVFICGSLCSTRDVHVAANNLYILDKYDRLRICDIDGKILSYKFNVLAKKICTFNERLMYIGDGDFDINIPEEILLTFTSKLSFFVITSNLIYFLDNSDLKKVSHNFELGNVNIGSDGKCYYLENEKLFCVE